MKFATPPLLALMRANTRLPYADCFLLLTNFGADIGQLAEQALGNPTGQPFFFTSADKDVQIGNFLYLSNGPNISGIRYRLRKGLSVDEQTITITADDDDLVGGIPFIKAIAAGLLDGARFEQNRAFFNPDTWPGRPGDPTKAVGSIKVFAGSVSQVVEVGRTKALLRVKSDLKLLNVDMPRNLYQPSCLHTLYDQGCGLLRTLFLVTGVVGAASNAKTINWTNSFATGYFAQGVIKFTSGQNAGQSRPVQASTGTTVTLAYPAQFSPAANDTFVIYPGCDHTLSTCKNKFRNDRNYRGFPYVPPPETAI